MEFLRVYLAGVEEIVAGGDECAPPGAGRNRQQQGRVPLPPEDLRAVLAPVRTVWERLERPAAQKLVEAATRTELVKVAGFVGRADAPEILADRLAQRLEEQLRLGAPIMSPVGWLASRALPQRQERGDKHVAGGAPCGCRAAAARDRDRPGVGPRAPRGRSVPGRRSDLRVRALAQLNRPRSSLWTAFSRPLEPTSHCCNERSAGGHTSLRAKPRKPRYTPPRTALRLTADTSTPRSPLVSRTLTDRQRSPRSDHQRCSARCTPRGTGP